MATHARFEADLERAGDGQGTELRQPARRSSTPSAQQSVLPWNPAASPAVVTGKRRIMTREQGRALETIGHAVDYLQDIYLHNGPDQEILGSDSPAMEAVRILVATRRELLNSLPLRETFSQRTRNVLFHRKSTANPAPVVR